MTTDLPGFHGDSVTSVTIINSLCVTRSSATGENNWRWPGNETAEQQQLKNSSFAQTSDHKTFEHLTCTILNSGYKVRMSQSDLGDLIQSRHVLTDRLHRNHKRNAISSFI